MKRKTDFLRTFALFLALAGASETVALADPACVSILQRHSTCEQIDASLRNRTARDSAVVE